MLFKRSTSSSPSSPSSILQLKSRIKWTLNGTSRIRPAEQTLDKIIPICTKIGVSRLADITDMDRLFIPNYSAILPGTEDKIWVYSGKGWTKADAKASALMEAIERYSSLTINASKSAKFIQGSYSQVSGSHKNIKVLHPAEVVEAVKPEINDNSILDFMYGFDLLSKNKEQVLVPASLALYAYSPTPPAVNPFMFDHTNGLASGNVMEEAICHAFCEVIERDAVSIAKLCSSAIPYSILEKITNHLKENKYAISSICFEDEFIDDASLFPDVDISQIVEEFHPIKILVEKFIDANLQLLIKNITQEDIGIPTFLASCVERIGDSGYFSYGHGTHPDARIALMRAITEVSQDRAGHIQGARDDLKKIKLKENEESWKRRWQFMPASSLGSSSTSSSKHTDNKNSNNIVKFSEIKTYLSNDILDDIKLILTSLKRAGLKRAIIVDLTNPQIGIPVVRAIVPGLETFSVSYSIMGRRAKQYFKRKILKEVIT